MNDKKVIVLGLTVAVMVVAIASVAVTSVAAASDTFDDEINGYILGEAKSQIDTYYTGPDECKGWARQVVKDASDKLLYDVPTGQVWYWPERNLPATQPSYDRWYETYWTVVVAQGTSSICNYYWMFEPGQIIQLRHSYNGGTPHTMIIESATPWGFQVIDANWDFDSKVQSHWISQYWFNTRVESWTVYQIR